MEIFKYIFVSFLVLLVFSPIILDLLVGDRRTEARNEVLFELHKKRKNNIE